MASVGDLEIKVEVGGDTALWRGQEFCGIAWDLGVREWELERSQLAFDRLLSGVDGSALSLDQAVKAAIGDTMIDRAVAVLRGSGREFIITKQLNPTDLQERGEVRIHEMDLNVTEYGGAEVVARFRVVPLPAHHFGWRRAEARRDTLVTHLRSPGLLERSLCHIESFPPHEFYLTTDRGRVTCRRCLDLLERL